MVALLAALFVPAGASARINEAASIYGVTVDRTDQQADTVAALAGLTRFPTTRVVFDEFVPAADYTSFVAAIHPVSYVMGELLDSSAMSQYTLAQYQARATEYLNALGSQVDIWEVGNEVNGEWLGSISSVVAKITDAYNQAEARGYPTALTLYLNDGCEPDAAHEMFNWEQANVSSAMRAGLDYVFVSYYEDDCNDIQPDWNSVFTRLAQDFPNSKLGVGEAGTTFADRKVSYINRYYGMNFPAISRYVGGVFWWYFWEDMVSKTKPLWTTLNNAIQGELPPPPPPLPNPQTVGTVPAIAPTTTPPPIVRKCRVPRLKRKSLKAAKRAIRHANCTLGKVKKRPSNKVKRGRVISQRPKAGAQLPNGAMVKLTVSRG